MKLILQIGHLDPFLDEPLDEFEIVHLTTFETPTIMKNKSIVIIGQDFPAYISFASFTVRYTLKERHESSSEE
jgi:hypothetical protein